MEGEKGSTLLIPEEIVLSQQHKAHQITRTCIKVQ